MSRIKRYMEQAEDRGWWDGPDETVCDRHVDDEALARLIVERANSATCSYCDRTGSAPFAARLDVVIERIGTSLPHEWGNADDEGVPWEGGYAGTTYDTYNLLTDALGDAPLNNTELVADVVRSLPQHAWAQRDFFRLRPGQRLSSAWDDFGAIVKHERRYFFSGFDLRQDDVDYMTPGELLDEIGQAVRDAGLVITLDSGEHVYRVRTHAHDEHYRTAKDLGAPPADKAKSAGRMNAAGIPLFYGARDPATALDEARFAAADASACTTGDFRLMRSAALIDLSSAPVVPSLFDPDNRHLRAPLIFLRHFVEEINRPFQRDDRIHIQYVPTQVITEWFRTRFKSGDGEPIDGIMYGSARRPGGVNVVLFVDDSDAVDLGTNSSGALLELVEHHRAVSPATCGGTARA